jgi:quinoprotein glucose dehydrogenase
MQKPYAVLDVHHEGEGGLMGLALHPHFPERPYLYVMHTYKAGGKHGKSVLTLAQ